MSFTEIFQRPPDAISNKLGMAYLSTALALHFLGCAFLWARRIDRDATQAKTEHAKQLAEQDERICKLETQVAALTLTPKP